MEGVDRMKGVRAGGGGGLEEARKIRGIGIADRVGWSLVGGGGARASRRPATTVFDGWGVVLLERAPRPQSVFSVLYPGSGLEGNGIRGTTPTTLDSARARRTRAERRRWGSGGPPRREKIYLTLLPFFCCTVR